MVSDARPLTRLEITNSPAPQDAQYLNDQLTEHNYMHVKNDQHRPLAIFLLPVIAFLP